jgi:hypothetical protein
MRQLSRAACTGFIVAAILAACGRAAVPAGYDFVTHSLPNGPTSPAMTAAVEGTLARTGESVTGGHCPVVVGGSHDATIVAWPEQFTLVVSSDGRFEVHGAEKVLRQGDHVRLGGGFIDASFVHHSIQGACQDARYFAAETFP